MICTLSSLRTMPLAMSSLVLNFASAHQTENPLGFSEVGENKQPARPACRAGYL